jgi:hypothetical protein
MTITAVDVAELVKALSSRATNNRRASAIAEGSTLAEYQGAHASLDERASDALTALAGERDELRKALGDARELMTVLIDNDPDEPISDAGHVVLDLWRDNARKWIARASLPKGE